jgi:hypothetical protein
MANIKWGFIAASASFFASFGIGLLFGVGVLHIIIRALIFAVVFFTAGFGLRFVINNFFPEFFSRQDEYENQDKDEQHPGSNVNIVLDTEGKYALPELYKTPGDPDELGNIEDMVSGYFKPNSEGIDRIRKESYNQEGRINNKDSLSDIQEAEGLGFEDEPVFEKSHVGKPVINPSFGDSSGGMGGLPDLDAMAMAFSSGESSFEVFSANEQQYNDTGSDLSDNADMKQSSYTGNKPQTLEGDFNPKELAKGISTILQKEK